MHYDCERRLLPRTLLKHRLLRRAGWTVVTVPWYEWDHIDSKEARLAYVRTLLRTLKAAGVDVRTRDELAADERRAAPDRAPRPQTPVTQR